MKRLSIWLSVLCLLTLLVSPAFGQGRTTGTISGTVTDPQGAVVPNAQVTVSDPSTGLTRTVAADSQGFFTVPDLPASTYTVTVVQPGFKQYKASSVDLHIASTVTLPIQLQLGGSTEVVNVEATDIQVQTDSAQVGEVVNGQQVRELPLNGRSFVQLTQLQPGVSAANNFDSKNKGLLAGVDFSVNGNPNTNNLFLVDGANNNDTGSNRTIIIYPSIDAIAEFKMLRNSYGAEYGQASGAVINIATRSGSNQWHGGVSYFGRNDAMNSYEYFAAQTAAAQRIQTGTATPKDKLRRNDYGYFIAGPAIKDKLFFFFNQEWNKEIRGATRQACVPSAAEKNGDFTADPSCPNGGKPNFTQAEVDAGIAMPFLSGATASHVLNPANLDPAGKLLVGMLPDPNLAQLVNNNNWSASPASKINWRQENVRVDYNLNSANTIMGRFTKDSWENPAPNYQAGGLWGDDPFPSVEGNWSQPSKQVVAKLTSTIGGTFVNDVSFTYSANDIIITEGGTNPEIQTQLTELIPGNFPESFKTAHSRIPTIWGGFGAYANTNIWSIAPWVNNLGIYTIRDDASKVMGNHTFKAGVFFGWDGKNEDASTSGSEGQTFGTADWDTTRATGNNVANVLYPLAMQPNTANPGWGLDETSTNVRVELRWHDYEFYVADTWKARRNLTIDLGLRYSWLPYPHSPRNAFSSFQPELYNATVGPADPCNGMWIAPGTNWCTEANELFGATNFGSGIQGPNNTLMYNNKTMFAPRLGIAWDPWGDGNTSVRAGFGMFYQRERVSPSYVNEANSPFAVTINRRRPFGQSMGFAGGNASPAGGRDPQDVVPVSYQWNLSVERGFAKNTTLSIGYVGNRAAHLTNNWDLNQIDPNSVVPNFTAGGIAYTDVPGWVAGAFSNNDNGQKNYRPYRGWGSLNYWGHNGDASYHSLQTLFKTRYKRSEVQAAYTWSHSISNVQLDNSSGGLGAQAYTLPYDPSFDKGNSAINRPHMFVANAIINLPELRDRNGMVRNVLGGWEFGVIQSIASGNSFTVYQNGFSECTAFDADHPEANDCVVRTWHIDPDTGVGSWNLLAGANALGSIQGTGYTNYQRPLITGNACKGDGVQIANADAFTLIGYEIGSVSSLAATAPRGYCAGPSYINTDLSINKNWQVPFVQNEKMRIQFRLDLFNAFNHANFRADQIQGTPFQNANCGAAQVAGGPGTLDAPVEGTLTGGYLPCTPLNRVITKQNEQSGFGLSTRTRGAREIQYGLKLVF